MILRSVYYVWYDVLLELIYGKTQIHGFSFTMNYGLVDQLQQYKSTSMLLRKLQLPSANLNATVPYIHTVQEFIHNVIYNYILKTIYKLPYNITTESDKIVIKNTLKTTIYH